MRVNVEVHVYGEDHWDPLASTNLDVKAMPEGLGSVDWALLCAGLIESALGEAMSKQEKSDEAVATEG